MSELNILERLTALGIPADFCVNFVPLSESDLSPFAAVTSKTEFFAAARAYNAQILETFMEVGVLFTGTDGVILSPSAIIGAGTVIHPGTQIRSGVTIGKNCVIGPNSIIEDSTIGDGCVVNATQIYSSVLEENVKIGPFSHVRPNSRLCKGVKVGDFVEIKNSTIGEDTHASHLTYIGDSDVGARVNFGCGVATANYNGYAKARTTIGDDAFIGCNTNLVAPVTIGAGGYTAAGSTIVEEVPADALGIARARQVVKLGWAARLREKYKKFKKK